jgi:hypothetical protein
MTKVPGFLLDEQPQTPYPQKALGFFDLLMPPQTVILVILLMIIAPVALLTGESLLSPLIDWVRAIFMAESASVVADTLPAFFFLKFGLFVVLCFLGGVQLLLRLNTLYYGTWAMVLDSPHPLHPPYQPDPQLSSLALLNWNAYRLLHIVGPPALTLVVMFGLGFIELWLFNLLSGVPMFGLPLQMIAATFLFLIMGLVFVCACLRSVWVLLYTLFGDVMAVTEPDLPVRTMFERCRRIALVSPRVIALYPAYALFYMGLLAAVVWLLITYDIEDLIGLKADVVQLLGIQSLLFGVYMLLNFWNLSCYHHALVTYYQRLPATLKDRLTSAVNR